MVLQPVHTKDYRESQFMDIEGAHFDMITKSDQEDSSAVGDKGIFGRQAIG